MDKLEIIVNELDYKVKKIVYLHQNTLIEIQNKNTIIENQKKQIEEQTNIINELEKKLTLQKITKTLEQGKDNYQTKLKINEFVREVDKCIALLNK